MSDDLYHQLVALTEDYLGPAASRFVDRQIAAHLNKDPHEITHGDLPRILDWTKVTLSLLTQDRQVIDEYSARMTRLMNEANLSPNGAAHNP
jgi:hypothetical protein